MTNNLYYDNIHVLQKQYVPRYLYKKIHSSHNSYYWKWETLIKKNIFLFITGYFANKDNKINIQVPCLYWNTDSHIIWPWPLFNIANFWMGDTENSYKILKIMRLIMSPCTNRGYLNCGIFHNTILLAMTLGQWAIYKWENWETLRNYIYLHVILILSNRMGYKVQREVLLPKICENIRYIYN